MKLIIVDFEKRRKVNEHSVYDLENKFIRQYDKLVDRFHKNYNIEEIRNFNFKENYKVELSKKAS